MQSIEIQDSFHLRLEDLAARPGHEVRTRMDGMEIPESARVFTQGDKIKMCVSEHTDMLREYRRARQWAKPVVPNTLSSAIERFQFRVRPGLLSVSRSSTITEALIVETWDQLEELGLLISNVNDSDVNDPMENRMIKSTTRENTCIESQMFNKR